MEETISADEAVVLSAGTMPISSRRWFANESGSYGVSFDFESHSGAATMTGVAAKCRNRCWPEWTEDWVRRQLDGNREKPNGDNKPWSF